MQSKLARTMLFQVATAAFLLPSLALAQPKADDIVGIRIGMSSDEVKAAIKKHEPAMELQEIRSEKDPRMPGGGGVGIIEAKTCVTGPGRRCSERIKVEFTRFGEKVVSVQRSVTKPNIGLATEVIDSIVQKYGEPTDRSVLTAGWSYDTNNKLLKKGVGCSMTKVTPEYAKMGAIPCGLSISAEVKGHPGQPTDSFNITMRDWKRSVDDTEQYMEAIKASEEARNRAVQGNRSKL